MPRLVPSALIACTLWSAIPSASAIAQNRIYWTDSTTNQIWRANWDGSDASAIINLAVGSEPRGIAVDSLHAHVYWTENGTNRIRRSDLDGGNIVNLPLTGLVFPADLELDVENNLLYFADRDLEHLRRANLDGTNHQLVRDLSAGTAAQAPYFVELDLVNDKLYWSDFNNTIIRRSNLDGTGSETVITGQIRVRDMAIDPAAGVIYWADRDSRLIQRQNLNGSGRTTLYGPTGLTLPHGVAIDPASGLIIWADSDGRTVFRGSLDGTAPMQVLASIGLQNPWDVDLYYAPIPEPSSVLLGLVGLAAITTYRGIWRSRVAT